MIKGEYYLRIEIIYICIFLPHFLIFSPPLILSSPVLGFIEHIRYICSGWGISGKFPFLNIALSCMLFIPAFRAISLLILVDLFASTATDLPLLVSAMRQNRLLLPNSAALSNQPFREMSFQWQGWEVLSWLLAQTQSWTSEYTVPKKRKASPCS